MSAKFILDTEAMHDSFFTDTALIGIVSALPSYRFCGMINDCFDLKLCRDGDFDICMKTSQNISHYFALYRYDAPMNSNHFSVYKLKSNKQALLTELKQLDYLFMIQGPDADEDANKYIDAMRSINDIQLAQFIQPEKLKNVDYLLI